MSRLVRIGFLAAFILLAVRLSAAQETTTRAAANAFLKPTVQDRVVPDDSLLRFRTELRPAGRVDLDDYILRAEYDVSARVAPRQEPEAAALAYLAESAAKFGLRQPSNELVVKNVVHGRRSSHVTFQQVYEAIPVYNREIKVNLDADGQPTFVVNGFSPHLRGDASLRTTPTIDAVAAASRVRAAGLGDLVTTTPELVVYPSKPARLAWSMLAWPEQGTVEWEVLVDAHSGSIIQMLDRSPHAHRPAAPGTHRTSSSPTTASSRSAQTAAALHHTTEPANHPPQSQSPSIPSFTPTPATASSASPVPRFASSAGPLRGPNVPSPSSSPSPSPSSSVDGTGLVFDPDPLATAGVSYGAPYVDDNDSDKPELNAERVQVTLRDISQGTDGLYRLEGPYVIIDDGTRGDPYSPPAESTPDAFQYTRAHDHFEAVMAYYHVDKSQRYVQSLDVGFAIKNDPILVNPQAYGDDNSQFLPSHNILVFGTGGVDDAEDADVIWHEYAHALLHFSAPGLLSNFEGTAIHEGWSDYWAASYSRYLSEEEPMVQPHDWWRVFTWDGNVPCWPGRPLDHPGNYPDDTQYPTSGCVGYDAHYEYGMLWGTTLMEIYDDLGRTVTDRLNLASHAYLGSSSTFPDAAQAIIQADEDLYGGVHANVLIDRFAARGYVDPSAYGPILSHDPLDATEDLGGEVRVEVTAVETNAVIDSVLVYFGSDETLDDRIVLHPTGDNVFAGQLPLPSQPAEVRYYVEAVDVDGRRRRLPSAAPFETYQFNVGPDSVPPTIAHESPLNVSIVGWPMDVYAEVRDNLGVDTVWVEYAIESADGAALTEGAFGLTDTGDAFFGTFPATAHKIQEGESVSYRIYARDISSAGNIMVSPGEGSYHVGVVDQGVLRAYDFEGLGQGLQAMGLWQRGTPEFGLRTAHSGEHVWATSPAAAYPITSQTSSLQLPPVDLSGIGSTYLIFWHWYDFEHDDLARPGEFHEDARLWDGANVKVSTDAGESWTVVDPEGGYNGTISELHANPLGGEPGFGGYSYGWRREIVPLPSESDVRVRFDFGTDDDNRDASLYFAGWYIDDVSITTIYPEDDAPPVATTLPDARRVVVPDGHSTPSVAITTEDDTGIEAVLSTYRITTSTGEETGSIRLAMSTTDRRIYAGDVVPSHTFQAGDRIEYSLVVRDFNGNVTEYPAAGSAFVVDFRAAQESNALMRVVSTGAWLRQGATWVTAGPTSNEPVSSLVLEPFTLPTNSELAALVLDHRFETDGDHGGNVKITDDDGRTWTVLEPEEGYPSSLTGGDSHPMENEGVFAGTSGGTAASTFDLSEYAGRKVRLRFDFASSGPVDPDGEWFVERASYHALSPDIDFETRYELELQANFPDPFADQTTISYSVPERSPVRVSVYDLLGRRVALVQHVEQEEGIYTVQFDGSGLASGVYMLYLETRMGTRTERMVIAR